MGYIGRPEIEPRRIENARELVSHGTSVSDAARISGVSRQTLTRRGVLRREASSKIDWIDVYEHLKRDWQETLRTANQSARRLNHLLNVMVIAERDYGIDPTAVDVEDLFREIKRLRNQVKARTAIAINE